MKKLQVGVIGLGMGQFHVDGFKTHEGCEVVAIADKDEQRLGRFGETYGITRCYADPLQMLKSEKLDMVSIATPNAFHKPLTLAAFAAGCHVLCEKPMALNAADGQDMIEAAHKAQRRLMINFSYRFNEHAWALKKKVEKGLLGDVYFARTYWHRRRGLPGFGGWFGRKEISGGGPLIDLGVHRLDLALWLMNYPKPTWVMGSTYDFIASRLAREQGKKFDVEDMAVGLVKFENGATLEVEASWAANIKEIELIGTQLLGTQGGLIQRNVQEGSGFESELSLEEDGDLYDLKLKTQGPSIRSSYHHFVDCILNDHSHMATGEEGLIVMKILDALYESARTGEPVRIV